MRIRELPTKRYPLYVRCVLWLQRRKFGRILEPALLWGRMPRAFFTFTLLYRSIDRAASPLEPELRSLVQVRVSQINWCAFCVDLNSAAALARHSSREKLDALSRYRESELFSDRERAALGYAEAMTDSTRRVDDALFSQLRRHFSEQEIVELTALTAFQNMSSKFNAALDVPAHGFCVIAAPAKSAAAQSEHKSVYDPEHGRRARRDEDDG